ncbi:exodeoxyribonuclease VII large subunit [Aporhodopirellula aestuarii]|uniref:Exodeoxyribonuclease 7 large subunit n=1 Tax=Aporhodopirellula aestuarii TaxID=2950107 RepID=A0ABT0TXE5_9BACT|nr:exodeoxyribonuclease VII large subunit [Aporhodopirellula aestuarii]MCM2369054.1 exodeoxyribonuclease VII large subunit [Aporhodopirellula aestuarii]
MTADQQQLPFDFGGGEDGEDAGDDGHATPAAPKKAGAARKKAVRKKREPKVEKGLVAKKPASTAEEALSISEVTLRIKQAVESSLSSMWVAGEITDIARPRSGHLYFTLKDERSQLRGVMWRSTAERLPFELDDGQSVLCFGDIEVYAARGTVQMVVRKCQPQGMGALQLALAQLQAKLESEGLFAIERKRRLPRVPRKIAIVTSPTGAAIRDFLQAAASRHAGVEIVLIPSSVQGPGSVEMLIEGIAAAHRLDPLPDVLIVSRGGGSLEDLWSFNEERFVRALARSRIPTVSAVGHEIDVTLSDLVADVRALTPTDAAIQVLPDREVLVDVLDALDGVMRRSLFRRIDASRQRLDWIESRPIFRNPFELVLNRSRIVDELDERARSAMRRRLEQNESRVKQLAAAVSALSPLSVLSRGYSVTQTEDGTVVRNVGDVNAGQTLRSRVSDGFIESTVQRSKP